MAAAQELLNFERQLSEDKKEWLLYQISGDLQYKSITQYTKEVTTQPGRYAGPGEAFALAQHLHRPVVMLYKAEENSALIYAYLPDLTLQQVKAFIENNGLYGFLARRHKRLRL